jgi:glycosyltransferase involved in cell wall biosynthesis
MPANGPRRSEAESSKTLDKLPPDEIHVSVIVPAFNMELFIEQCLRSLFDQTLDGLEVIVVDDGSTDRTRAVVESLTPPEGKFLRLVSKPNGGLSSARNAGIRAAHGRWIGFVDADDWVASTMYSVLSSRADRAGADLAIARGLLVDPVSGAQHPFQDILRWNEVIAAHGSHLNPRNCPDLFTLDTSACRRVYRRSFLENIRFSFRDGTLFEDVIANYQLLFRTNSVVLIDEALYFYRVGHPGRITARKDHALLDILIVLNIVIDELWKHSAGAELWANFIFFQSWVMLWLCAQITDEHRERLISGAASIALRFPARGLGRFRQKFRHDTRASTAVQLQLYGNAHLFAEFAQTQVASERAKKLVNSDILRWFFIARAQLTSRLARIDSQRKLRRLESDLGARRVPLG